MEVLFSLLPNERLQEQLVQKFPDVRFTFQKGINEEKLSVAEVLVTYGEDLSKELLSTAKRLKWIMVASAGMEKMPLKEIGERGILVTNARGIHKIPMAESIIGHLLSVKKSLHKMRENQVRGEWIKRLPSSELYGSTALILGPGAIGGEVGRLLQAFGVKTIGCNRSGQKAEFMDSMVSFEKLEQALPAADILISVLPSTEETRGLLTSKHLQKMKPTSIFMNFGRGDLIKEDELLEALEKQYIAFAVLDVFEEEPLKDGHPFWRMENVIVSPHVSSHSSKYLVRVLDIFCTNLTHWMHNKKEYVNEVDVLRGY